ncbi:Uma2 family endonuclease [Actinomadura sp. HBU206391]|uniref:Uma2 family endonuclease n=1 Tax=Actinomadura sp. HBU206391 TaxID=2731692 RepID=UPI00164F3435|nr:Uma2 family endonuclease [Actinomadura sp. HBU206391]MBC6461211.1 Uma2 family endonuclease [Actinomadura sp. HBU206391]
MSDHDGFTVEDWLALPERGQRVELIDGSFVVSPQAATNHQLCTGRLRTLLAVSAPEDLEVVEAANLICADEGAIPDLVVADADVMVAATVALEPHHVRLVAEVVSPGNKNRKRDYQDKPRMYAAAGIPVFLRVELTGPGAPRVQVFELRDGDYALATEAAAGQALQLTEPFKVSFDPAELAGLRRREA